MKKLTALSILLLHAAIAGSQVYQPTWESLDKRPVPGWFTDGKFGIFIHWGVYAVPAYTTKGEYAEWYLNGLTNGDSAKKAFHKAKFGDISYYQFADQFKAELFNPDEWAKLFERSGAKYIVLTSKHHDGYALWPSKDASRTWGFPWNAQETGPKRDLLGDLFKAVRNTSVRAGMYYSLYEWYNPLWKTNRSKYATEHMWPQMKELINNYQPDVFWTDGDWDAADSTWRSKEFLTWLYNESPVKNKVVTYDRWGSGIRFKHGQVFTPEYQPDLDFEDHVWEESRGMGHSYGYNREEDAWDYNSTQSLVYHLLDKVSRGGNFLLDIGPDEHGKIPPIMQERLLQIGDWLKINGEAIYETQRWKRPAQWSEGRRDYKAKKDEDIMMKLTVNPEPGYATKDIFYTYNKNTNTLYAIFPKYPSGRKLVLKDMQGTDNINIGDIHFLATGEKLPYTKQGNNLVITLPEYDPNRISAPYAYAVRIRNNGAFMTKPKLQLSYATDLSSATIQVNAKEQNANIMYQVNNTPPAKYTGPFAVKGEAVVKAFTTGSGTVAGSDTTSIHVDGFRLQKATNLSSPAKGLSYKYYEADKMNMSVLAGVNPIKEGVTEKITNALKQRVSKFGLSFEGYIYIDQTAGYSFYLSSDDGSILEIDGNIIVNNDGDHGTVEKEGKCILEKGYHTIRLRYFDSAGDNRLLLRYSPVGGVINELPPSILFH